jgi:hypothetical protein
VQKLKNILFEGSELKPGQTVTLSIPYGTSKLQFKGVLVSVNGKYAKVKYKTGQREITTDAPLEWIS